MPTIADWLMVLITFVYVIATIKIYRANIDSNNIIKEQLSESKREYEETQRLQVIPYLHISFSDSDVSNAVPCLFLEMRNDKEDYITKQTFFSLNTKT